MNTTHRQFLARSTALASSATLGGSALAQTTEIKPPLVSEQGFVNPCGGVLPPALANHEVIRAAWSGLDPAACWDSDAHLVRTGDTGSGIALNPSMYSVFNARMFVQRMFSYPLPRCDAALLRRLPRARWLFGCRNGCRTYRSTQSQSTAFFVRPRATSAVRRARLCAERVYDEGVFRVEIGSGTQDYLRGAR